MAILNKLVRAPANTITVVPGSAITAPTFAFEDTYAVFYTRDAAAGAPASPNVFNSIVTIEKTNASDVFAVGADVFLDVSEQEALTVGGDGKMGIASKASANGDTTVEVYLNV